MRAVCGKDVAGFPCARAPGHSGVCVASDDPLFAEAHAVLHRLAEERGCTIEEALEAVGRSVVVGPAAYRERKTLLGEIARRQGDPQGDRRDL